MKKLSSEFTTSRVGLGVMLAAVAFVVVGCNSADTTATTNTNTAAVNTNTAVETTTNTSAVPEDKGTIVDSSEVSVTIVDDEDDTSVESDAATSGLVEPETTTEATATVKEINVSARQFEFDPATITVNQGDTVRLNIASEDVDHGISIPDFGVSSTLSAGETTTLEFTTDKTGTFSFFCNVFCGSGHGSMKGTLVVQ